jgi:hypothetical protein
VIVEEENQLDATAGPIRQAAEGRTACMQRVESNIFARGFDSTLAPAADALIRERLGTSKCQLPRFSQPFGAKAGTEQPYPR